MEHDEAVEQNNVSTRSSEPSTSAHTVEGTGLGLTLTRSPVRMQDGDLTLNRVPDHGSTFSFTLPLV